MTSPDDLLALINRALVAQGADGQLTFNQEDGEYKLTYRDREATLNVADSDTSMFDMLLSDIEHDAAENKRRWALKNEALTLLSDDHLWALRLDKQGNHVRDGEDRRPH